jgi:pyruvate dehydrogenase E2 component (dihydrolipoamide acetyltransferase)
MKRFGRTNYRKSAGELASVVALVETEKGVIEVEIFESGVIESLVVQPGQKVPVGATLATLSGDGKKVEAPPAKPAISPTPTAAAKVEPAPPNIAITAAVAHPRYSYLWLKDESISVL